jgi:hypothetical protein
MLIFLDLLFWLPETNLTFLLSYYYGKSVVIWTVRPAAVCPLISNTLLGPRHRVQVQRVNTFVAHDDVAKFGE